jgi:HEAT repeat protein
MKRLATIFYPLGCVVWFLSSAVPACAAPVTLDGAKWIWFSREPMPSSQNFPGGVHYFRSSVLVPSGVRSAEVAIAADNLYTLFINGKIAGESAADPQAWNRPKRFDVSTMLVPGTNVFAVEAVNTAPGPAGLVIKFAAQLTDGNRIVLASDESWKCSDNEETQWEQPSFDDVKWRAAHVVGDFGVMPWGKIEAGTTVPGGGPIDDLRQRQLAGIEEHKAAARLSNSQSPRPVVEISPPADYPWPEAVVFLGDDRSLYRPSSLAGNSMDSLSVTIFNPHHSRAFPEHDLPAPIKVGGKLFVLKPARPGVEPRLLLDAGRGGIGSPSVSFDGGWIYVSMARDTDPFFHIYKIPAQGGEPQRLTEGPFHDIDPAELPDGTVVFSSTRIGTFEEYHNPPSRSLFTMNASGLNIRPLTHTFIFDNEPKVMADGRILFVRSDNFFDRGKVETILHAIHPDGTGGYTEYGLDMGPEYGGRLRAFNCGSPAPMPDGRVAFVTGSSIAIGQPGCAAKDLRHIGLEACDVASLPDGRLLCTLPEKNPKPSSKNKPTVNDFSFEKLAIVDPQNDGDQVVILHNSQQGPIHSPAFLGPRTRPTLLAEKADLSKAEDSKATGFFFCQNARFTKNTTAGWTHVRAIRVLAGKGLTLRSSHSYIVHAGSEVTELGTVPLAPDGSFSVEVPADTAIAFQAVDAEGRSELNEMSWIYVRPGESRGCVGCHQSRQDAPPHAAPAMQAMRSRPLKLLGFGRPHRFRGNNPAVTGLMEMQFDRYREVAGINRHSESSDPLATGEQESDTLIAHLLGTDEGLKISSAQRLAIYRAAKAAPALAECLSSKSLEVRVAAAMALATCGARESIPPLLAALADPEPLAAQACAVALENLTGCSNAFNAFAVPKVRASQVAEWRDWFQKNSWEKIESQLVRQLEDPDRNKVRRAAVALGRIGSEPARAALRACLSRERENNPYPAWIESHRGDEARFNSRSTANPRTAQAIARALGFLKDAKAVPLLAEILIRNSDPETSNLFLAESSVEALGRIGTREAEEALTAALARLKDYYYYVGWYGDHSALYACHASPVHYLIAEALDSMGSTRAGDILAHLIRSVPTDPDRALLPGNDDCEALVGRVIRRNGAESLVVETCLSMLGDASASKDKGIEQAISTTYQAWAGKPDPENRAAQILSLVCRDRKQELRVRAAFDRYRAKKVDIARVFDTGIPVVTALPVKNWVCFFLARALANLGDSQSAPSLISALEDDPAEAASGRPDPLGPGVLFIHNDLTPCWRAAAAYALGRIGDRIAAPVLLKVIGNLDNAPDTRHAAAEALARIAEPSSLAALQKLAENYPEVSTQKALRRACEAVSANRD